jgi:hypothetical protein
MDYNPKPSTCGDTSTGFDIDAGARAISDRYFVNVRSETYRCLRMRGAMVFSTPWGPRMDLIFDPKGASHVVGGTIRVLARTAGTEVEVASVTITSVDQPVALTVAVGCDEYVVQASSGSDPPGGTKPLDCYFFARVYDGR